MNEKAEAFRQITLAKRFFVARTGLQVPLMDWLTAAKDAVLVLQLRCAAADE